MKVGTSNPVASIAADVTPEVRPRAEVALATSIDVAEGGSLPLEPICLPTWDHASDPSAYKEKKKGKGRLTVGKVARKARPGEPSNSGSDDLGVDPFDNPDIIRDLTDKFAMPEVVDHMADLDQMQFVWDFLRTFLKSHNLPSPIDADPLLQGVLLKPLMKSLKKEVYHLKKKLKKMEDDLQASWKNALKATKEVTHLQNLHMKDFASFSIRKNSFERKIAELKKNASDKSWTLMAKISSLEVDLKIVKEKIHLLEGSSPWSTDKAQYD
ncbi:hypothetical protein COCNU_scaffold001466G000050 [Cocos nucifera]|nr:hypothetical protein [Cocos nucifera]